MGRYRGESSNSNSRQSEDPSQTLYVQLLDQPDGNDEGDPQLLAEMGMVAESNSEYEHQRLMAGRYQFLYVLTRRVDSCILYLVEVTWTTENSALDSG